MSFQKMLLSAAEIARPVITKIIPAKLLSSVKAKVISSAGNDLGKHPYEDFDANAYPNGINLLANIKAYTGLGESSRIVAKQIEESGVNVAIKEFYIPPCNVRGDTTYDDKLTTETPYNINLIHLNASELPLAFMNLGKQLWDKRYNIGFWLWELEEFPEEWMSSFNLLDEIWTPSEFISKTLRKYTDKPVVTVPHSVVAPTDDKYDRAFFGLPEDRFLYLMMFDSGSVMERKNPLAIIEAFKKAFPVGEENAGGAQQNACDTKSASGTQNTSGVQNTSGTQNTSRKPALVVKINEPELSVKDEQIIKEALGESYEVYFICGTFSKVQVNSLIKAVDVYVSLHRAEGFGLVMAEAMCVGTPAIATDYSANTEFMNSDVACMVGYDMIELDKDYPPFKKGYHWANPHVDEAAEYIRRLYEDENFYNNIRTNALNYAKEKLAYGEGATIIKTRVAQILDKTKKGELKGIEHSNG